MNNVVIGGSTFTANGNPATTAGRFILRDPEVGAPVYEVRRYATMGADGNIVRRFGKRGRHFLFRLRYTEATVTACTALMEADKAAWATALASIACAAGTFAYCNMIQDSFRIARPIHWTGRGMVSCEAVVEFTEDQ